MTVARSGSLVVLLLLLLFAPAPAQDTDQRSLLVGTKVVKPFAFKNADDQWTGISIDLWQRIAEENGYVFEWREAQNTNALVEMVAQGEVHVGIAAITMKPSRAALVDFSNSHFESGLGIAVRSEAPGPLSMLQGLFSGKFLGAIGGLCLILFGVGFLIWLAERRGNPEEFENDPARGLWSGFWWSAVTMTTVGYGDKSPRTVFGRILGLVWMFAGIIMISSFTAVIASSLTTQTLQSRVQGEDDLYDVRVGAKSGESPADILRQRGIQPHEFDSIGAGLRALAAGEIEAFVHDQPVLRYEILEGASLGESLHVLAQTIREEEYGIAVRPTERRNVLRDEINAALLEMKISGELAQIEESYLGR